MRALLRNRQASQGAHCCSGHVCWSAALQQLHIAGLPSPTPSCLLARSAPSFIRLQIAFSPLLALLESRGCSQEFIGCFGEVLPPPAGYWSGLEKPRRLDISNTRLKRASQPAPAHAFNFPIAYLVFHVRGKFWERSHASRDNRQLYDPQALSRLISEVTELLPCTVEFITHQYALVAFMDIFDYAVKAK